MPLRKFHSVEEMPPPPAAAPLDPRNFQRALALSELAYRLRPWRLRPGVHKYRSVADKDRSALRREAMRAT